MRHPSRLLWTGLALTCALAQGACSRREAVDPDPGIRAVPCFTGPSLPNGRVIPGHYIVLYRDTVDGAAAGGRLPALNRRVLSRYGVPEAAVRSAFAGLQSGAVCRLSPGQAAALRGAPEVALVEPDRVVSIAACITPVDSTTLGWGTRRTGYADGTGKTAWVIDSGIDLHHPDLHVDGERSLSFLEGQSSAADLNGHGTHVAGIIGARNNAIGTLGVASGATLVALKVLDQLGEGSVSAVVKALNYVAAHARRGDVVNISLVGNTLSQALDREIAGPGLHWPPGRPGRRSRGSENPFWRAGRPAPGAVVQAQFVVLAAPVRVVVGEAGARTELAGELNLQLPRVGEAFGVYLHHPPGKVAGQFGGRRFGNDDPVNGRTVDHVVGKRLAVAFRTGRDHVVEQRERIARVQPPDHRRGAGAGRFLLPMAGSGPAAETIIQAIFERVWNNASSIAPHPSFEAVLFAIALTELLAHVRRQFPATATPKPGEPAPADPYARLAGSLRLHPY